MKSPERTRHGGGYRCSGAAATYERRGRSALLEVLRSGARRMLQEVIEPEVETFLGAHADLEDARGQRRLVRNGHAPEREIQIGIGPIAVRRPKVRDRGDGTGGGDAPSSCEENRMPTWQRILATLVSMVAVSFVPGLIWSAIFAFPLPSYVAGLIGGSTAIPVWEFLGRVKPKDQA